MFDAHCHGLQCLQSDVDLLWFLRKQILFVFSYKQLFYIYFKQVSNLQKQIDDAQNALAECRRVQDANRGELEGAYSEKESRERTKENANDQFAEQLGIWSFESVDDYHIALSPEGISMESNELADWISIKKNVQKNF